MSGEQAVDREPYVVGQSVERDFLITDEAVRAFAEVSGDINPVHLDEDFARRTIFRGRVAHGMLLAGHLSAVLGNELPGPGSIYQGQTLNFEHPVRIGDTVTVKVTVKSIDGSRMILTTLVLVGDKVALSGEASAILPRQRRPKDQSA
jgi:3-hydroxybutyryl-CoA dehydratase